MDYPVNMAATTCEPPRVAEPSAVEMIKRCGDLIYEDMAIADAMLRMVGAVRDADPKERPAPSCMLDALKMCIMDASALHEMLERLSVLLGG